MGYWQKERERMIQTDTLGERERERERERNKNLTNRKSPRNPKITLTKK